MTQIYIIYFISIIILLARKMNVETQLLSETIFGIIAL